MRSTPTISLAPFRLARSRCTSVSSTALSALSANSSVSMPMGKVASRQVPYGPSKLMPSQGICNSWRRMAAKLSRSRSVWKPIRS